MNRDFHNNTDIIQEVDLLTKVTFFLLVLGINIRWDKTFGS